MSSIPKIILDTDPGGDDVFALLWLLSLVHQGLAELLAVTTAEGNVSAHRTFATASRILTLGGYPQIEVGRAAVPAHPPITGDAAHIHGADGMGNLSHTLTGEHQFETARASDDILLEALTSQPGEITVVAIAPLTNLAAAEAKHPGVLQLAKEIVIMGGSFQVPGNITPQAEFNIAYNPEAAQTVFQSRQDLVLIPLDISRHLIWTEAMGQAVSQANPQSAIAQLLEKLCQFMISTALKYRETQGVRGFLVHDAVTVGYLFYPETLLLRRARVQVETQGQWTRGQTLIDHRHGAKPPANAWIGLQVDATNFFISLVEDLKFLVQHPSAPET